MIVKDSNGNLPCAGGTEAVEGKVSGGVMVLKASFLKKK